MRTVQRAFRVSLMALGCAFATLGPAAAYFEAVQQRAWDVERPVEALAEWELAGEAADGQAMLALGRAYVKGPGVPQDFVEAYKWLYLAAGLDSAEAAAEWDALAKEMTAKERAEARKLPRSWRSRVQAVAEKKAKEELKRKFPPGEAFRDCEGCPEMVIVPAGSFTMGSPASDADRNDDEGPQHRVTISQPLAVGKFEVTRKEFERFASVTHHRTEYSCWTVENREWKERSGRGYWDPGYRQTDRDPVACVNWGDAQAYVAWLSRKTGKRYRLLTEAEWEYAARAGTTSSFHFGKTISIDQANYYRRKTVPVGSFPSNGFGLHDMHGNAWEWVEDCWHDSYAGAPTDGSAWNTSGDCDLRIRRGGSFFNYPWILRSALRSWAATQLRSHYNGFRVARTLTP